MWPAVLMYSVLPLQSREMRSSSPVQSANTRDAPVTISSISGDGGKLPLDPRKNTSSFVVLKFLEYIRTHKEQDCTGHISLELKNTCRSAAEWEAVPPVPPPHLLQPMNFWDGPAPKWSWYTSQLKGTGRLRLSPCRQCRSGNSGQLRSHQKLQPAGPHCHSSARKALLLAGSPAY